MCVCNWRYVRELWAVCEREREREVQETLGGEEMHHICSLVWNVSQLAESLYIHLTFPSSASPTS